MRFLFYIEKRKIHDYLNEKECVFKGFGVLQTTRLYCSICLLLSFIVLFQ